MAVMTVLAGSVGWAVEGTGARPPAAEPQKEGVIEPKADAALRKMSDYLSGLKSVKAKAVTVDEKYTKEGQKVQELQQSKLTVQRPSEMRVDRVSPRGHSVLIDDGRQLSLYNKERNAFAITPAPQKLDDAIDEVRERLHVEAPGGDLLVSNPYETLTEGTVTGRYIGLEPIEGVMAHHLAFTKDDVDWQIWIKDGPDAVPLRYVITSKDVPSRPQFTLEMREWEPNATVSADDFKFKPPSGAKKVDFSKPETK
jgi:hypothetical protein